VIDGIRDPPAPSKPARHRGRQMRHRTQRPEARQSRRSARLSVRIGTIAGCAELADRGDVQTRSSTRTHADDSVSSERMVLHTACGYARSSTIVTRCRLVTVLGVAGPMSRRPPHRAARERRRDKPGDQLARAGVSLTCQVAVQRSQPIRYPGAARSALPPTATAPVLVLLVAGFEKYREAERSSDHRGRVLVPFQSER
jgi:hypothetical protein